VEIGPSDLTARHGKGTSRPVIKDGRGVGRVSLRQASRRAPKASAPGVRRVIGHRVRHHHQRCSDRTSGVGAVALPRSAPDRRLGNTWDNDGEVTHSSAAFGSHVHRASSSADGHPRDRNGACSGAMAEEAGGIPSNRGPSHRSIVTDTDFGRCPLWIACRLALRAIWQARARVSTRQPRTWEG
jgi:hypothetical protein